MNQRVNLGKLGLQELLALFARHPILHYLDSRPKEVLAALELQKPKPEPTVTIWWCTECKWLVFLNLHYNCYRNHQEEVKSINVPLRLLNGTAA